MPFDPSTASQDSNGFDADTAVIEPSANPPPIPEHEDPMLKEQWAKGGIVDRIKMIVPWLSKNGAASFIRDTPILAIKDAGLQGVGSAVGQAVGGPPGGAIGGAAGNAISQGIDMATGNQPAFSPGRMVGAGVAGAIPGSSLAGSGIGRIAANAAKFAIGNVGAKTAETAVDESRMPTLGEAAIAAGAGAVAAPVAALMDSGSAAASYFAKKSLYGVRDATLKEARSAGYVIPSSRVNDSTINNVSESLAGKAAVSQEAAIRNQSVTNKLARKSIGLAADDPLTPQSISDVRDEAGLAYQRIANLSTDAAETLEKLKQARYDKNLQYSYFQRSGSPDALMASKAAGNLADSLETKLETYATGKPKLVDDLRAARVLIAKTYQVDNALNAADGNISASVLGRSFDKGNPLTGELATIGKFQQAFPTFARDASAIPSPGVGKTKAFASLILSGAGSHMLGPAGAVLGSALPFSDALARKAILSNAWQRSTLGGPNYGIPSPDLAASFIRFSTQAAGRQSTPYFLTKQPP